MGCYTKWDSYLERGSEPYLRKRDELQARFFSLVHLINYYFEVFKKSPSEAVHEGGMSYQIITNSDPLADDEYDTICRHLACDGVHHDEIYDIESLINSENKLSCMYAYILIQCATRLRSNGGKYFMNLHSKPLNDSETRVTPWFKNSTN